MEESVWFVEFVHQRSVPFTTKHSTCHLRRMQTPMYPALCTATTQASSDWHVMIAELSEGAKKIGHSLPTNKGS